MKLNEYISTCKNWHKPIIVRDANTDSYCFTISTAKIAIDKCLSWDCDRIEPYKDCYIAYVL